MINRFFLTLFLFFFSTFAIDVAASPFPYQAALDTYYQQDYPLALKYLALDSSPPSPQRVFLASLALIESGATESALAAYKAVDFSVLPLTTYSPMIHLKFLLADSTAKTASLNETLANLPVTSPLYPSFAVQVAQRHILDRQFADAHRIFGTLSPALLEASALRGWMQTSVETKDLASAQTAYTLWVLKAYKVSEIDSALIPFNAAFRTQKTTLDFISSPELLLQFVRGLYDRQDYGPFQKYAGVFLSRYPTHNGAVEVETQMGVSQFLLKHYEDSIPVFDHVISTYSGTYWAEKALYYKARAHFKLNESTVSKVLCMALIDNGRHAEWVGQAWVYLYWCFEAEHDLPGFVKLYMDRTPQLAPGTRLDELVWKIVWEEYRVGHVSSAYRILLHHPLGQSTDEFKAKVLFWLGKMAQSCDPTKAHYYFEKCFTKFPFSFYSSRIGQTLPQFSASTISSKVKSMGVTADPLYMQLGDYGLGEWAILELKPQVTASPTKAYTLAKLYTQTNRPHQAISALSKGAMCLQYNGYYCRELMEILYPRPFWDAVQTNSKEFGVDPYLTLSLMREESRFNPRATSHVGAMGLMQLMPSTASGLAQGLSIPWDSPFQGYTPSINIRLGTRYLSRLKTQFNNDFTQILSAYNAGPGATRKWIETYSPTSPDFFAASIPYRETHDYVAKVLKSYWVYRILY